MKLTFWGAAGIVTGSLHQLDVDGKRYLLDCGLAQGRRKEADQKNRHLPVDARSVAAVLLSHAHIDQREPAHAGENGSADRSSPLRRPLTCATPCCATRRTFRSMTPSSSTNALRGGARRATPTSARRSRSSRFSPWKTPSVPCRCFSPSGTTHPKAWTST